MRGVRGQGKTPGEFRRSQNWIGPPGADIDRASYIPCSVNHLPGALTAWEKYLNDDTPDVLVQVSLAHAEFEAIHPFMDGNGRIGRVLVPLVLVSKVILSAPTFYISEYLEEHRGEYFERLLAISRDGDWDGWLRFFLHAIETQAQWNAQRAERIRQLYLEHRDRVLEITRSPHGVRALDQLHATPVFMIPRFIESSGIPGPTARRILKLLQEHQMIRQVVPARGQIGAIFVYPDLLSIVEGS